MSKKRKSLSFEQILGQSDWLQYIIPIILVFGGGFTFNLLAAPKLHQHYTGQLYEQALLRNTGFGFMAYCLFIAAGTKVYQLMQKENGLIKWLILPLALLSISLIAMICIYFPHPNSLVNLLSVFTMLYMFSFMLAGLVDATVHCYRQKGWLRKHGPMLIAYLGVYWIIVPALLGNICIVYTLMVN